MLFPLILNVCLCDYSRFYCTYVHFMFLIYVMHCRHCRKATLEDEEGSTQVSVIVIELTYSTYVASVLCLLVPVQKILKTCAGHVNMEYCLGPRPTVG